MWAGILGEGAHYRGRQAESSPPPSEDFRVSGRPLPFMAPCSPLPGTHGTPPLRSRNALHHLTVCRRGAGLPWANTGP